jgi:hypothetical protein
MIKKIYNEKQFNYSSDAKLVVSQLEAVHPVFLFYDTISGYEEAKSEYIKSTRTRITFTEFRLATLKYTAVLGDGHICLGLLSASELSYINIDWVANDGRLYLLDKEKKPTDIEITSIGGVPASDVMAQVDIYYAAENEAARQNNYTIFCKQEDMLVMAGCEYISPNIELNTSYGGKFISKFIPINITDLFDTKVEYIIRYEMINDVFYVDLRKFRPDKIIDDTAEKIKNAIQSGTKKFIIDIRDNAGGNSNIGEQLLRAMRMTVPSYGMYVRHSKLALKQHGYKTKEKSSIYEPDKNTAIPNEDITLLVLTNVNTFSSASIFGVWTQDGKLGKIVGQISRNSPNHYGEMLLIDLPISGIKFIVSCKKFLRPDTEASSDSLIPDIEVPFGEDILAAALNYMASIK